MNDAKIEHSRDAGIGLGYSSYTYHPNLFDVSLHNELSYASLDLVTMYNFEIEKYIGFIKADPGYLGEKLYYLDKSHIAEIEPSINFCDKSLDNGNYARRVVWLRTITSYMGYFPLCVLTENGHLFIHIRMRNGVTKTMLINKHLNDWKLTHNEDFTSDFKSIHDISCYDVATAIHRGKSPKFFMCLWNCHIVEVSVIERIVPCKEDETKEEMDVNNLGQVENDKPEVNSNDDQKEANHQKNTEDKQKNSNLSEKATKPPLKTRGTARNCRTINKKTIAEEELESSKESNKNESESDEDSDSAYVPSDVNSSDDEYEFEESEEDERDRKRTNKNKKGTDKPDNSKDKKKQPIKTSNNNNNNNQVEFKNIPEIKPITEHTYSIKDTQIGDNLISYKFEFKYLFKSIKPVFIGSFLNGFVAINRQEFYIFYKGKLVKKLLINLPYFPSSAPHCSSINNMVGVAIACGSYVWYAQLEITEDESNVKVLSFGPINVGTVVVSAQYMIDYLGILIMTEDGRIDVYKLITNEANLLKPALLYSRQHLNLSNKSCVNALIRVHSLHPISGAVPKLDSPNESLKSVSRFIVISSNAVPFRHRLARFYKLQELSAIWEELLAPENESWMVNEYACYTRIELQNTKSNMYFNFAENMRKVAEQMANNPAYKKTKRPRKSLAVESLGIGISTDNLTNMIEDDKTTKNIYNSNGNAEDRLEHVMNYDIMVCPPIIDIDEDEMSIIPPNECKVCGFMCPFSDEEKIINSDQYKGFIYCPRCMSVMSCILCKDYL